MVAIELKPEHGYVLVCAGALAFESLALGGAVGAARAKAFGKEWRDRPAVKALAEEHKKAFPNRKFADGGYPDVRSYGGVHTRNYAAATQTLTLSLHSPRRRWGRADTATCSRTKSGFTSITHSVATRICSKRCLRR